MAERGEDAVTREDEPESGPTTVCERGGAPGPVALPTVAHDPVVDALLAPQDEVLSTLNRDGSRRWLRPRVSRGRFLSARRWVAFGLIAMFALIPHIPIGGKPLMLLDVAHRQFTFLGATFYPTDTVLLALFMLAAFIGVFLFTAVLGRVWCGWACPQTVYLEFLYRPLERLFDGTRGRGGSTPAPRAAWRTAALYACYLGASLLLAHTFLAYFVGVDALAEWMRRSPLEHPGSFAVMAVTTGLMMFNFCYFREQTCLLACPYGRLQSVLLDRESLIISYDEQRGEPRGRIRRGESAASAGGDCIDCGLCVVTCPTGIDIRRGLQMECVACAQCIDACDFVMDRVNRRRGLIRYTSQAGLSREPARLARPRVLVYATALAIVAAALALTLWTWPAASVEVLRGVGTPFSATADGRVANPFRLKITNRSDREAQYFVRVEEAPSSTLTLNPDPIRIAPGETVTVQALLMRPSAAATTRAECRIRVRDDAGFDEAQPFVLLGPAERSEAAHDAP